MKYQVLEHKADLKIKAFGRIKKELFENAMFGRSYKSRHLLRLRYLPKKRQNLAGNSII